MFIGPGWLLVYSTSASVPLVLTNESRVCDPVSRNGRQKISAYHTGMQSLLFIVGHALQTRASFGPFFIAKLSEP